MVTMLTRKLLRDLLAMKGQVLTIALVVAAGVASLVMHLSSYESLLEAQRRFYTQARFADAFLELRRAPQALAARIGDIPGVAQWESRLVTNVLLDMPGVTEPVTGRFISLPEAGRERLNRLHLRRGRMPGAGRGDEVVVSDGFALVHKLNPGDRVTAVLNGRKQTLRVAGMALSPEFVYAIPGGIPLPDDRRFGVFWMPERALAAAFDAQGAFNSVSVGLVAGASLPAVLLALDTLAEPYGGLGAYGRADQPSNRMLSEEILQQRNMAGVLPPVFLSVACFLVFIVTGRLVRVQREQIAALKALGYANRAVGLHYLQLVSVIVALGSAMGIALGSWAGSAITLLYQDYFRFPVLEYRLPWFYAAAGVSASWAAAAAGALAAVSWATGLPPAEAMRPPAPPVYARGWIERVVETGWFSPQARMAIRHISRRPWQSLVTSLGVGLAAGIIVVGGFWIDAVEHIITVQFRLAQRDDVAVGFAHPLAPRALAELRSVPGVLAVEGLRAVPVRLRAAQRSYLTAIQGLQPGARLRLPRDDALKPIRIPAAGLLLSNGLGRILAVAPGDRVVVEVLEGARIRREAAVAGLVNDLAGVSAYMDQGALNRWLKEGPLVSGAALAVDPEASARVTRDLRDRPLVASLALRRALLESFTELSGRNIVTMSLILGALASIVAVGVVYNSARIALSERAWELASLRVLGFTRGEVTAILLGKLAAEVALGIPLGFLLGRWGAQGLLAMVSNETMVIPLLITPRVNAYAALVVAAAGTFSAALVRRQINRLDLVAVLKARD